jgi:hypothetical protein
MFFESVFLSFLLFILQPKCDDDSANFFSAVPAGCFLQGSIANGSSQLQRCRFLEVALIPPPPPLPAALLLLLLAPTAVRN